MPSGTPERFDSGVLTEKPRGGARPVHVLIVEDQQQLRTTLASIARRMSYEVTEADDGEPALESILERTPDIIVLDLVLPRMDGYRFMEELARQFGLGRPRVLVMSESTRLDLARAWLGADAYLAKPFDMDRFTAALRRLALPVVRGAVR